MKHIILFEESNTIERLNPLILMRPLAELRVGLYTVIEKWQKLLPGNKFYIQTREYLQKQLDDKIDPKNCPENTEKIWINSQVLPNIKISRSVLELKNNEQIYHMGRLVATTSNSLVPYLFNQSTESVPDNPGVKWINYPWDMVEINGEAIRDDLPLARKDKIFINPLRLDKNWINPEEIYVDKNAQVYPSVVINAEKGPVIIDADCAIFPFTYIEGPAYIGNNATLKAHTKIYGDTTIGPVCKVAGEISNSILHSYVNKQHEGFLGSSYLSPWVNLGADTNISNLKNNYSSIRVAINNEPIDTGLTFAGLYAGDHAKSGINTMFNTGTVLGCFANIFGGDYPDKFIPSFAWGSTSPYSTYDLEKAIATAKIVVARRGLTVSPADENLIRHIFKITEDIRNG